MEWLKRAPSGARFLFPPVKGGGARRVGIAKGVSFNVYGNIAWSGLDFGKLIVITTDDDSVLSCMVKGGHQDFRWFPPATFQMPCWKKELHTHVDPVLDAVETGRFVELGEGFLTVHE
jgi:hypothetical protein